MLLSRIHAIVLSRCFEKADVEHIKAICNEFQEVIFPGYQQNYIGDLTAPQIANLFYALALNNNVEYFSYNYRPICCLQMSFIEGVVNASSETLSLLNLSYSTISDEILERFSNLECKVITSLYMYNCEITNTRMKYVINFTKKNSSLTCIDLKNNYIEAAGVNALVDTITFLKHVDLSNNELGIEGGHEIVRFINSSPKLHHIFLAENHIGDEGVRLMFEGAKKHENLKYLGLDNNNITDKSTCYIAALIRQGLLMAENGFYDLKYNLITHVGALRLSSALCASNNCYSLEIKKYSTIQAVSFEETANYEDEEEMEMWVNPAKNEGVIALKENLNIMSPFSLKPKAWSTYAFARKVESPVYKSLN